MKRHYPELVGDIIKQAIEKSDAAETFQQQRACYLWSEIVGPAVNRMTTRRWVDRDTLHVVIASGAIKNELSFMTSRLITLINQAIGKDVIAHIVIH